MDRSFIHNELYIIKFRYDAPFVKELVSLINKARTKKQSTLYEHKHKVEWIDCVKNEVRDFADFECQHALDKFLYHYEHCRRQKVSTFDKQPAFDVMPLFDSVIGGFAKFTHYIIKNEIIHSKTQPVNRKNIIFQNGEFEHPFYEDVITALNFVVGNETISIKIKSLLKYVVTIEREFNFVLRNPSQESESESDVSDGLDSEFDE